MKKLKISKLEVKSFVTEMDADAQQTVKGGIFSFPPFCGGGGNDTNWPNCGGGTVGCTQLQCPTDHPCATGGGEP